MKTAVTHLLVCCPFENSSSQREQDTVSPGKTKTSKGLAVFSPFLGVINTQTKLVIHCLLPQLSKNL